MKSLYLENWDTFIRYHELPGKDPTLVYLAGLGFPVLESFLPVITHPEMTGRHSLLIDTIGAGSSERCQTFDYSLESHAQSVAAVLDKEGARNCSVIGHSMGGTVGIQLAILRPDLVSNLIIAEANLTPGGGSATKRIASFPEEEYLHEGHPAFMDHLKAAEKGGSAFAAFLNAAWHKADPRGIYRSSVALVNLEPTFIEQYLKMPIPRTFIYGEDSLPADQKSYGPDVPDPIPLAAAGVQIGVVPNAGHGMMADNPDGFVTTLKKALQESN